MSHGGGLERVEFEGDVIVDGVPERDDRLPALSDALEKSAAAWRERTQLVKLLYFAGHSLREAAQAPGIFVATTKR